MKKYLYLMTAGLLVAGFYFTSCKKEVQVLPDTVPTESMSKLRGEEALSVGGEVTVVSEEDLREGNPLLEAVRTASGGSDCFGKLLWDNSTLITYSNGTQVIATPIEAKGESNHLVTVLGEKEELTSFIIKVTPNGKGEGNNFTIGMYTPDCKLMHYSNYVNGRFTEGLNNMGKLKIQGTNLERYGTAIWNNRLSVPCIDEVIDCAIGIFTGGWLVPCIKALKCILHAILD